MPADFRSNHLLAALTRGDRPSWTEQLEQVELSARFELHQQGMVATHIHFPTSALVVMNHRSDASDTPLALVGNDGMVGVAAFMGTGTETNRAVVLHPGLAWCLPTRGEVGPAVTLWQPHQGGHVGFPAGQFPGHLAQLPQSVGQWLSDHL